MKGRIPKTDEQKRISGTLQECRNTSPLMVQKMAAMPRPPRFLSKNAKKMYYLKGASLLQQNVLTEFDLENFVIWCHEAGKFFDFAERIEKLDTIKDRAVLKMVLRMQDQAFSRMNILSKEFGLTPLSRMKFVKTHNPDQLEIDFDNL